MIDIKEYLSKELGLGLSFIENALKLREEGSTVPFIARYRKEMTSGMDEIVLRSLFDRFDYLTELEDRKVTILQTISDQGKLTDELRWAIEACLKKNELEDLYLPFKPKRRTRATIAREKGLEPLAELIKRHNQRHAPRLDLEKEAEKYISSEKGISTVKEALQGASDIIAEEIAETAALRSFIREYLLIEGRFVSKIKDDIPAGTTKFENYRDFEIPVKTISPHIMLALRRGEAEEIISLDLKYDEPYIIGWLESKITATQQRELIDYLQATVKDGFTRLMKHSIIGEVRLLKKSQADEASIAVFEQNLRQMLLAPPAGMKPTIGMDPGFRTGCKVAVVGETGKFLEYANIFPTGSDREQKKASELLASLLEKYRIDLIAIGNGTASRETDRFVEDLFKSIHRKPIKVTVNEAGASVYSASETAAAEFPDLDLTVRGAISIARRLQDPLAELVKIDPKSIGVGQYQHDVDQKLLKKKLEETVVSCVNFVGVDLNTASKQLLTYVSGITPKLAENIVAWRNENGRFVARKQLLKVSKFGEKAFEQAAGFLRIRDGENILDNTAVHPESYHVVQSIATDIALNLDQIIKDSSCLKKINIRKYVTDSVGEPTIKDIIAELEKPGRDPREEFRYASFSDGIESISDLRQGMVLEGIVTNVTNFGAFVDIGVHQDGLVHISELSDRFVRDPMQVVKVGQIVSVKVLEIDESLRRIKLSMKQAKN